MPGRPFKVIAKAHRTQVVEFALEIVANSRSEAEARGLSEARKTLRTGGEIRAVSTKTTPWHVIDAVPVDVPGEG